MGPPGVVEGGPSSVRGGTRGEKGIPQGRHFPRAPPQPYPQSRTVSFGWSKSGTSHPPVRKGR